MDAATRKYLATIGARGGKAGGENAMQLTKQNPAVHGGSINVKPKKIVVSRAEAASWDAANLLIQVKADGVFATREIEAGGKLHTIAGEFVTRKSGGFLTPQHRQLLTGNPGGYFVAFDLLTYPDAATSDRWAALETLVPFFPADMVLVETLTRGEIPDGAEGIVAKPFGAPYGEMLCCKVLDTFFCRVTSTGGSQSVGIADAASGAARGRVTLRGGKCDRVRIGSVIKVAGMGLTDGGQIREPRLCCDTPASWLVRF